MILQLIDILESFFFKPSDFKFTAGIFLFVVLYIFLKEDLFLIAWGLSTLDVLRNNWRARRDSNSQHHPKC